MRQTLTHARTWPFDKLGKAVGWQTKEHPHPVWGRPEVTPSPFLLPGQGTSAQSGGLDSEILSLRKAPVLMEMGCPPGVRLEGRETKNSPAPALPELRSTPRVPGHPHPCLRVSQSLGHSYCPMRN